MDAEVGAEYEAQRRARIPPLEHLFPLLLLLANALLVFLPSLPSLRWALVGDLKTHPVDSAWLYFLTQKALWHWPPGPVSPYYHWPAGFDVLKEFADMGNAALASPLTAILGPINAYNLFQILQVWAAGIAAYAFGFHLLGHRGAALMAGLLFADMDQLLFSIHWGEDDVASMWMIPAYLTLLFRSLERAPRDAFAAGAFLGLVGWFNSYFVFFNVLFTGVVGLAELWRHLRGAGGTRPGPYLMAFLAGFGLIYGSRPFIGIRASHIDLSLHTADYIRSMEDLRRVNPTFNPFSNLDLAAFLDPFSPTRRLAGRNGFQEGVFYLGLLPLGLAGAGLLAAGIRRRWLVAAIGAIGLILALGAYLKLEGRVVLLAGGRPIPLPQGPLAGIIPFMSRMNHPFRFCILTYLAVAVLAAGGALTAARRITRHPALQVAVISALAVLCLAERYQATPNMAPIRSARASLPAVFRSLPRVEGHPAVLHLPFPRNRLPFEDIEPNRLHRYAQLAGHRRPLAALPEGTWLERPATPAAMHEALAALYRQGVGVIVVMPELAAYARAVNRVVAPHEAFAREQLPATRANLQRCIRPEVRDGVEIYVLRAPERLDCPAGATE